ncbi:hypothetical protein LG326_16790 (plasmid) [Metaplanococcus flavidus]
MASAKEKKINKILLWIAFPFLTLAIILSLTGIVPLPPQTTIIGIILLILALITFIKSSKKQNTK